MIAIPTHNVEERAANPHYAGLLALLAEHALKTDDGWLVAYEMHNPIMRYLIAGEFAAPDPIPPKPTTAMLEAVQTSQAVKSRPALSGDALIDAMGYTPASARAEVRRGSCCDPPKA